MSKAKITNTLPTSPNKGCPGLPIHFLVSSMCEYVFIRSFRLADSECLCACWYGTDIGACETPEKKGGVDVRLLWLVPERDGIKKGLAAFSCTSDFM